MSTKALNNWSGLISIVWMLGGYAVLYLIVAPHDWHFSPLWLHMLVVVACWLGVGLWFVIIGLRYGSLAGRLAAMLGLGVFLFLAWSEVIGPVFIRAHQK